MFSRGAPALCVALLACASAAPARGGVPLRPGEPPLPGDLVSLANKMEGVQVTSERFRVRTAMSAAGSHLPPGAEELFKLLALDLSGEVALSPPSGAFAFALLGHTFRVRLVHETAYLYEPSLARGDGGRPWLDVGHAGQSEMLVSAGTLGLPASPRATPFKSLASILSGARSATELGPGTVDGAAVMGFDATVAASALEEPQTPSGPPSILTGIFSRVRRHTPAPAPAPHAPAPPRSAQVEVFIAPTGLPVRTHISESSEGVSVSALGEVFAINFPLHITPPPRRQTIALAALRALSKTHAAPKGAETHED